MVKNSCPVCPKCNVRMQPAGDSTCKGMCKCPSCGAVYIPAECQGIFIPASIIGIHQNVSEKSIIGIH